jgi:hypothetical protein
MKKEGILIIFLIALSLIAYSALAQDTPAVPAAVTGGINPQTGLPNSFNQFQETATKLSQEEQRKAYLTQEWTKLLADKKVVGPVLFYTNKYLVMLNPLWIIIFGIEFSWSWEFIFCIMIWIMLIVLIYAPAKGMTDYSPILSFIFSLLIASIIGTTGTIKKAVDMLTFFIKTRWIAYICLAVAIILVIAYSKIMKHYGKEIKEKTEKERTEEAQKKIQVMGRVAEKELNSYKDNKK